MRDAPVPRRLLRRLVPLELHGGVLPSAQSIAGVDLLVDRHDALAAFLALAGDASSGGAYTRYARLVRGAGGVALLGAWVACAGIQWGALTSGSALLRIVGGLAGLLVVLPFLERPTRGGWIPPGPRAFPVTTAAVGLLGVGAWVVGWLAAPWGVAGLGLALTGAAHALRLRLAGHYCCALVVVDPDVRDRLTRAGIVTVAVHPTN